MGRDGLPRCGRIRDCQDQPHLPSETLRQRHALELSCSQLGLQVAEASLNLDEHHSIGASENHVRRSAVRSRGHRNLEADAPGGMRRGPDHLGQAQLARVPEPDPVRRVQAYRELLPDPAGEESHRTQVRGKGAPLDPADHRLADASSRGKATLRQPRCSACVAHLLTEALYDVRPDHSSSMGLNALLPRYRPVTAPFVRMRP